MSASPTPAPASPSLDANPLVSDWLVFQVDGRVTLKTGKVEIGQGVLTALVQIAADELDIPPDRFDVLSGHTRQGPEEAATSSSLSMEVTGRAVRHAASAARHLLLDEAGRLLQTTPESLTVEAGAIRVEGRETPLTMAKLAADIATLAVPVAELANPKAVAERHLVGTSWPRIDLEARVSGSPYIHDMKRPGMRHGRILHPPADGRTLVRFDEAGLREIAPDIDAVRDGSFLGLVGDDEEAVIRAANRAADFVVWSEAAAPLLPIFEALGALDGEPTTVLEKGDLAIAAGRRLSMRVTKPYTAHASVAPSCAIATFQDDGTLEVLSHTQAPHGLIDGLAIALRMKADDITVIHAPGAGTYGHSGQDDAALDATLLARAFPGTPIRVVWSRADDFDCAPLGPAMIVDVAATLDEAGRIQAFTLEALSQPHARRPGRGGFADMPSASRLAEPLPKPTPGDVPTARGGGADRNAAPAYDIENVRLTKRILRDYPIRTSALRGLGAFANVFAIESLIDELAAASGTCPLAFRLAHLADPRARAVVQRAADMAGWPGPVDGSETLGLGFARYKNKSAYCAVAMRVSLEEEIKLLHAYAAVDAGEVVNPDGLKNQIEGSILQAASWTVKEAVAIEGDRVAVGGWENYPVLKFSEIPRVDVDLIDHPDQPSLGAGEAGIGPAAAAIGNAASRALGLRLVNLPLTRDAIRRAIEEADTAPAVREG
jgi:CO/xanthine dehydrogenase Mo-binding subunit